INTAINHMDRATQQNAAMVEQTTASIHRLSKEAEQLSGLVDEFRIGRDMQASASRDGLRGGAASRRGRPVLVGGAASRCAAAGEETSPSEGARLAHHGMSF